MYIITLERITSNQFLLEKISRIAHMSPFAFIVYFKKNCGAGFIEYLKQGKNEQSLLPPA